MTHIDIISRSYYSYDGKSATIGGVQTYITNLSQYLTGNGYDVTIIQRGEEDFKRESGYATILGFTTNSLRPQKLIKELYLKRCAQRAQGEKYITIIASDQVIPKVKIPNSIVIQHGISWDMIDESHKPFALAFLRKVAISYQLIRRLSNVENVVCVDYNYVNWYRTLESQRKVKLNVIPNFTSIPEPQPKTDEDPVRIIFARRLIKYRGTRLFCEVAHRLSQEYGHKIDITIAGDGPDKEWMLDKMKGCENVHFITYTSDESLKIHSGKHIAVVVTTGSEGTSLSLLEAMSASCAVICTNVGGMTNIVLDHYNGLMINPEETELYEALKMLIDDGAMRKKLAEKAYATARDSFSIGLWQERWLKVVKEVEQKYHS